MAKNFVGDTFKFSVGFFPLQIIGYFCADGSDPVFQDLWFLPLLIYIHSYPRYFAPLTFSYPKLLIPPGILPHFFLIQCTIVPIDMSKSNWAKCMEISPSEYYPRKWDDFLGFWRFFACRIASLRRLRRSWSTERYRDLERFLLRLNLQVRRVLRWAKW